MKNKVYAPLHGGLVPLGVKNPNPRQFVKYFDGHGFFKNKRLWIYKSNIRNWRMPSKLCFLVADKWENSSVWNYNLYQGRFTACQKEESGRVDNESALVAMVEHLHGQLVKYNYTNVMDLAENSQIVRKLSVEGIWADVLRPAMGLSDEVLFADRGEKAPAGLDHGVTYVLREIRPDSDGSEIYVGLLNKFGKFQLTHSRNVMVSIDAVWYDFSVTMLHQKKLCDVKGWKRKMAKSLLLKEA